MRNIRFMAACAALMLVVACGGGSGTGSGSDQEAAPGEPSEAPKTEPKTEPAADPTPAPAPQPSYHLSIEGVGKFEKGFEESQGQPFMTLTPGDAFFDIFASEKVCKIGDWWVNTPANPCGDFLWLRVEVPTAPNAEYPMAIEGISWAAVIDGEPYGYPLGTVIITSFGDGVIEGTFSWDAKDDGSFRVPTGTGVEMPPMY